MRKIVDKVKCIWNDENSNIKKTLSLLATVCSVIAAVASVVLAKQALDVSKIALTSTSATTEPILQMDIDWQRDIISVENLTSEIYTIYHVNYGAIRTIAICDEEINISSVELEEKATSINLEHGHTEGTDVSDKDAERYNKSFVLSLGNDSDWGIIEDNQESIDNIENKVIDFCKSNPTYEYWGVSPHFNYRYIEIYYKDAYGNRNIQYYIYKYEYGSSWEKYKLSEDEYLNYISNVITEYDEETVMTELTNMENFHNMDDTKYNNFYYEHTPRYYK